MVSVEEWAWLRREHFVNGVSIKKLVRRTGLSRNTIRKALRSEQPPAYRRRAAGSKLDAFEGEIHALLRELIRQIESQRIRELLVERGSRAARRSSMTIVREVRPFFLDQRTYQRTVYRPGDVAQFDLWQPKREIPVGYGQTRKGYVVVGALGFSRFGAGALVFSKEAPDVLWGMRRCVWRIGALPGRLVVDREGCLHAGGGRPSEEFAAFCGQLSVGWRILDPGDCEAKGVVERLQGFIETSFEPGRSFATSSTSRISWTAGLMSVRTSGCTARCASGRSTGWSASARACGRCPSRGRISTGGWCCGCRRSRTCTSIATTTRWIRGWSAGASRCASRSARSTPSRWTPASWRPGIGACSPPGRSSPIPSIRQSSSGCGWSAIAGKPPAGEDVQVRDLAVFDRLVGGIDGVRRPSSRTCSGR